VECKKKILGRERAVGREELNILHSNTEETSASKKFQRNNLLEISNS